MTRRLLRAGYRVTVWNRTPAKLEPVLAEGAVAAPSLRALAEQSSFVLLSVSDARAVEAVLFGPEGLAVGLRPASLIVDHSSIDPEATRAMARRLKTACGTGWVDAPVSGGVPGAAAGTLAIMAGGAAEDVERARPVLAHLCQRLTHMGPVGAGQTTKLCNQLIVGCTLAALAETTRLALDAGIDATRLPECLKGGWADSILLQLFVPRFLERSFSPPLGHVSTLMKDMDTILDLAKRTRSALPMAASAAQLFRQVMARGGAGLDPSALIALTDPVKIG
jgi:3-hydroxyisobutyrate dehydrogenase-like beta-hydroxyacid dehydrogenase